MTFPTINNSSTRMHACKSLPVWTMWFCCCQEDERIELFSHFLTEEWDEALLVALGTVYRLSEAPCPVPCIEYPAQVDMTLVKSSRQMDLVKVCLRTSGAAGVGLGHLC